MGQYLYYYPNFKPDEPRPYSLKRRDVFFRAGISVRHSVIRNTRTRKQLIHCNVGASACPILSPCLRTIIDCLFIDSFCDLCPCFRGTSDESNDVAEGVTVGAGSACPDIPPLFLPLTLWICVLLQVFLS